MSPDLLFSRMLDGQLTAEEEADLLRQLERAPSMRTYYAEFCQLHAMLEFEQETLQEMAGEFPRPLPDPVESSSPPRSKVWISGGIAACLVAALTLLFPRNQDPIEDETMAVVTDPKMETYHAELASLVSHPVPPYDAPVHVEKLEFNKHIRPILSDNCFNCHGPDSSSRKGGLRLDREMDAKESAIIPGDPDGSELIYRIVTDDTSDLMPPPKSHKTLTSQEIVLLKRWIAEGASWQEHWAFLPPKKEAVSGIDAFVDRRLKTQGLTPEPVADRRTLIRRVSLDLTGLPPSPEEVAGFLADDSPDAYERLVDRLLSSPRYGEHRARYWLDAARYADTHGLHLDNYREMWPYRDWVINAYNENQSFDQFTIDQLAGDLLPEPSQAQLVATGFNRCNVTTSEGGAISEEFLVRYAVDRVNTTSTVWLGLTTGCAQCHDHKFDPISQKEYFQLFAYFNHTTQGGMDGNRPDTPPVIRVYPDEESQKLETFLIAELRANQEELKAAKEEGMAAFETWRNAETATAGQFRGYQDRSTEGFSAPLSRDQPFTIMADIKAPNEPGRYPLCEQLDADGRGFRMVLDTIEEGVELTFLDGEGGMIQAQTIKHFRPGATVKLSWVYDGSGKAGGIVAHAGTRKMGRNRYPYLEIDTLKRDFATAAPLQITAEEGILRTIAFYDALTDEEIKELHSPDSIAKLLREAPVKKSDEKLLAHFFHTQHAPTRELLATQSDLQLQLDLLRRKVPVTHVMADKPGTPMAPILLRGEYDKPSDVTVEPGVPAALPPLPEDAPPNRLGLARWLVDPANPLPSRVAVNRIWQQFFGSGLVTTADDFGTQGDVPTYPELLDWLAVDFVENGWDVKHLIKQIVTSDVYKRGSRYSSADPENRYYARGPRFRMDAEMLRDQALFASGLLVESYGGPGVRPYQPDGLWQSVGYENSNTVKFYRHYDESLYRRSIYTFWKRTAPPPNMTAFDAPNRESCVMNRERTNTPLQALVLMNDVQYVEAARHLAERCYASSNVIQTMALYILGREFAPDESQIVEASLKAFRQHYAQHPEAASQLLTEGDQPNSPELEPTELAALTMVANQLLNLDEAITKH